MAADESSGHRLAGAIEKFNRAKEQFDELRCEMDSFFNKEPKPHFSRGEFDTETWEWVERFQVREEPPLRFGVILGDCVHNLRSCLDHIICQVTLLDGGTDCNETQFPIASKSEAQFEGMANRRIPALCAEHRALVKRAQPYHRGDKASRHPLAVLADLSNADKHRIVNPAYSFAEWDAAKTLDRLLDRYRGDGPSPVYAWWLAKGGSRLQHSTPWLRMEWRRDEEPPWEVKVGGDITLGVAFGEVGLDATDFKKIAEYIRLGILEPFTREFPETQYID